jgi:hypothetical protein
MDKSTILNLAGPGGSLGSGSYGNLCASCHQPRPLTISSVKDITTKKVLTASTSNTDSVYIYSSHYGPHDSPQAALLAGKSLFPIAGTAAYTNHPHSGAPNGCIACHMANPVGGLTGGGHSLNVAYTTPIVFPFSPTTAGTAINVNGCLQCHTGLTAAQALTNITASQATTQALLTQLLNIFVTNKWMTATGSLNASSSAPLKVTALQAKVIYNYQFVNNDQTIGVHNPTYAQALLTNSIAALQ